LDLQLSGLSALVTGSYRGTGLIIARALLAEGVEVFVHGMTPDQAEAAVQELAGGIPVSGDITNETGCLELTNQLPRIPDLLINSYGTAAPGRWQTTDTSDWLDLYQKNVLSAGRLIQHCLSNLRERGWGRIINLGTVGSTSPNARSPHYYAAKGALATMTISLAKEVAGSGIGVNLVSPGMIATPEVISSYLETGKLKGWGDDWETVQQHVAKDIPIRRLVTREEVADLVVFLCSPRADGIHGQNIRVDGGALGTVS
jgi:3-oxoacyl-[acyl-carrier protein] reductase